MTDTASVVNEALFSAVELMKKRLTAAAECESEESVKLIKNDDLIKMAKLISELTAAFDGGCGNDAGVVRFELDDKIKGWAK